MKKRTDLANKALVCVSIASFMETSKIIVNSQNLPNTQSDILVKTRETKSACSKS